MAEVRVTFHQRTLVFKLLLQIRECLWNASVLGMWTGNWSYTLWWIYDWGCCARRVQATIMEKGYVPKLLQVSLIFVLSIEWLCLSILLTWLTKRSAGLPYELDQSTYLLHSKGSELGVWTPTLQSMAVNIRGGADKSLAR